MSRRSIPTPASLKRGSSSTSDHSSDPEKAKYHNYTRILPASLSGPSISSRHSKADSTAKISSPSRTNSSTQLHKAASHGRDHPFILSEQPTFGQEDISMSALNDLTEQEKANFAISLQVFSDRVVSCVLSRELHLRLYALEFVKEHLENENVEDETNQHSDRVSFGQFRSGMCAILASAAGLISLRTI